MRLNEAGEIANTVDPDQPAPSRQSNLGLHWLLRLCVLIFRNVTVYLVDLQ